MGWPRVLFTVCVAALVVSSGAVALTGLEPTSGKIPVSAPNSPTVIIDTEGNDLELTDPFNDSTTIHLRQFTDKATAEFSGAPAANVAVKISEANGTWTNLTAMDVQNAELSVKPRNKKQFDVEGATDTLSVRSLAVDDGTVDFVVSGNNNLKSNITLRGLPSNQGIQAVNSSGDRVSWNQTTATGRVRLDIPHSTQTIKLQTQNARRPNIDDAEPLGKLRAPPTEVSVNVSDGNMPENVSVDIDLDGTDVTQTTIKSNQTVAGNIASRTLLAGEHTVDVTATDSAGLTESFSYTFEVPADIFVKNVSTPNQNITDANITVQAFGEDEPVRQFSGNNGVVNMTGFPATTPLVVRMSGHPDYHDRTTILKSLYDQQNVYMLNKTFDNRTVRWQIQDRSGDFDKKDTFVALARTLKTNGTFNYTRVSGGDAAVEGFTTNLRDGERYRIIVVNSEGDRRILGGYTAELDETVTLQVGQAVFEPDEDESFDVQTKYTNGTSTAYVKFAYTDPDDQTNRVNVKIHEAGNTNNKILDKSFGGPLGNVSANVTGAQSVDSWVIDFEIERNGETIDRQAQVGPRQPVNPGLSDFWQSLIGVSLLVVVSGLFGGVRASLGAVTVPLLAGLLWFIGWLPSVVGAGAILLALGLGALYLTSSPQGVPSR